MSRDDPPREVEGAICVEFLDTQICVDENGSVSVYTGAVDGESDDGFRVVATVPSIVGIGSYFDSFEDVERRLREWADENRDRIDACIRHAKEIASLSARVGHLEASLDAVRATLRAVLSDALSMGEYLARKDAEIEKLRTGLHRVSLASQNSMSSKEECGRIARETLEDKS